MSPPSSAPSSAATSVSDGAAGRAGGIAGVAAQRRLQRRRDIRRRAATAGHSPVTLASVRQPWSPSRQHHRHHRRAVGALGRQRNAGGPGVALPGLAPLGGGLDDFAGFRKELQRLAAQRRRQAGHADLEGVAFDLHLALAGQRLGLGVEARLERRAIGGRGAPDRNRERKLAVLGNAFEAADQPLGLELDVQVAAQQRRLEIGCDGQRHRQQHGAFVAVVGQAADRDLLRQGPGDVAGRHAGGQGPLQRAWAGRSRRSSSSRCATRAGASVAGRPRPAGAGRHAVRGMRHQLGAHAFGGDDVPGAACAQAQQRQGEGGDKKASAEAGRSWSVGARRLE